MVIVMKVVVLVYQQVIFKPFRKLCGWLDQCELVDNLVSLLSRTYTQTNRQNRQTELTVK